MTNLYSACDKSFKALYMYTNQNYFQKKKINITKWININQITKKTKYY